MCQVSHSLLDMEMSGCEVTARESGTAGLWYRHPGGCLPIVRLKGVQPSARLGC